MFVKIIVAEQTPEKYNLVASELTEMDFKQLCNMMLDGVQVFINSKPVKPCGSKPKYRWENRTLTPDNIPKALQKFKGTSEFYNKLVAYNQYVQTRVAEYIKKRTEWVQDLDMRNIAYRNIMECALRQHIKAKSPCERTKYEARANIAFENSYPIDKHPEIVLTDFEIENIKRLAPAFGLALPTNDYYIASREARRYLYDEQGKPIGEWQLKPGHTWREFRCADTDKERKQHATFIHEYKSHGYTEEIQRVFTTRENYFPESYDTRTGSKTSDKDYHAAFHPNAIPEEWVVQHDEIRQCQWKELQAQLNWFLNLPEEEMREYIIEPYAICPNCGNIVRKIQDDNKVLCELCDHHFEEDIIEVPNDALFYGTDIDLVYSDLDDLQNAISRQEEIA